MPTSSLGHLMHCLSAITTIDPRSSLEIGVGFGKYGFLMRESLDINPDENKGYADWERKFDGIEIYEKYITPVHNYIYDNIHIGNAFDILDTFEDSSYDLVFAIDVLEHFKKEEGKELIKKMRRTGKDVLIATPYGYYFQEECWNNPHEKHYSAWTVADFKKLGASYIWFSGVAIIAIFTDKKYPEFPNKLKDEFTLKDFHNMQLGMMMYYQTEQYQECVDLGRVYVKHLPNEAVVYTLMAISYDKLGNEERALKNAKQAVQLGEKQEEAQEIIEKYQNKRK